MMAVGIALAGCAGTPSGEIPACASADTPEGAVCGFYTRYLEVRTENPGEKPPLVDGCLFASLFEGPIAFTVEPATASGSVTRVPVQFRYGTEAAWQDVIVLSREGAGYVIDDIEFEGAGPFNPPGRLSEALDRAGE
jgi:hypothetical protein